MTTTFCTRLMVSAALVISPIAGSAQNAPNSTAQLAENTVESTGAAPAVAPKEAPAAVQEKKICKQLPSSYSRRTTRTCLTASEWKQVEAEAEGK
jgi:hypothetical protein